MAKCPQLLSNLCPTKSSQPWQMQTSKSTQLLKESQIHSQLVLVPLPRLRSNLWDPTCHLYPLWATFSEWQTVHLAVWFHHLSSELPWKSAKSKNSKDKRVKISLHKSMELKTLWTRALDNRDLEVIQLNKRSNQALANQIRSAKTTTRLSTPDLRLTCL